MDEVQRLPALLNEVHRHIEARGLMFRGARRQRTADGIDILPVKHFLAEVQGSALFG